MALLKIVWTATALKQRNHIFEYWNNRNKSKSYSQKINTKAKARISLLKTNPNLGVPTEIEGTRVLALGHFSIVYKRIDYNIIITAFWDNRQNPKRLLAFLKKN